MFNFNRVELKTMLTKLFNHLRDSQIAKCFGTPEAAAATKKENARREAKFERDKAHYEAQMKLKVGVLTVGSQIRAGFKAVSSRPAEEAEGRSVDS